MNKDQVQPDSETSGEGYTLTRSYGAKPDAFLKAYAECGTIKASALAAGCASRQSHYDWLNSIPGYRDAFEQAQASFADKIEDIALNRIMNPEGRIGSDVLLITYLNAHKPDKYRQYSQVNDDTAKELRSELQKLRKEWRENQKDKPGMGFIEETVQPAVIRMLDHKDKTG